MNKTDLETIVTKIVKETISAQGKKDSGKPLPPPPALTLSAAKEIIRRVEERAKSMGVRAVVAVYSAEAHPIAVECMDGAYIASYDIATGKAYTAASLQMSTADLKPLAQPGGSLYGIEHTGGGKIVIFGGGELLLRGGVIRGSVGVSGGTEEEDTALARYGQSVFGDITLL